MYQFSELKFRLAAFEVAAHDWHCGTTDKRYSSGSNKHPAAAKR